LIHEGAGRWKQVWALLKRLLLPRQFQDEETIRKKRRRKTRSDKKALLFFKKNSLGNVFIHICCFLNVFMEVFPASLYPWEKLWGNPI
jgi:hypothetical protein